MKTPAVLLLLLLSSWASLGTPTPRRHDARDNEIPAGDEGDDGDELRGFAADEDPAWRAAARVLDACGDRDLASCLGAKAVAALGRAARATRVAVARGVSLVRAPDASGEDAVVGKALTSEAEVQQSLDQAQPGDKMARLVDMLLEAASSLFRTHALQFRMPEDASQSLKRALDEGRGKKKILRTLMPLIMGIGLKLMALVPVGLGVVGLLAAKALLISKVALILAGVLLAQKLLGSGGGLSGLGSGGWASGNSGGTWSSPPGAAGWSSTGPGPSSYYRSLGDQASAHDLAYKAQAPSK